VKLQDVYTFEALKKDGTTITVGGDLTDCVRFSLVPHLPGLPPHYIAGVPMTNRFCRGFVSTSVGTAAPGVEGIDPGGYREYLHCVVTPTFRLYVKSTNGMAVITPPDLDLYL